MYMTPLPPPKRGMATADVVAMPSEWHAASAASSSNKSEQTVPQLDDAFGRASNRPEVFVVPFARRNSQPSGLKLLDELDVR